MIQDPGRGCIMIYKARATFPVYMNMVDTVSADAWSPRTISTDYFRLTPLSHPRRGNMSGDIWAYQTHTLRSGAARLCAAI